VTLVVIGLVLLAALALMLIYTTKRALVWILIAAFFATALHPAVTWVERRVTWCRRWLATLLVFLVVIVALIGVIALFVMPLVREGAQLAREFPELVREARAGRGPIGDLIERFRLREYADQHSGQIRQYMSNLTAPTLALVRGTATTVAGLVTIFFLSYLMVLEAPKIIDSALAVFSPRRAERIRRVGNDCARTVTGYITGNLLISVICGTLTYIVLLIMNVPFALLIALFVAIADLIPLVGATLGAIVAAGAGFLTSTRAGIVILIFFIAYQQLENHVLQPLIFSRTVRLNPLTVLIAILIAVELAGILGALLAIPVAGMIQVIARNVWDERRGRLKEEPTVGEERTPVDAAGPPQHDAGPPEHDAGAPQHDAGPPQHDAGAAQPSAVTSRAPSA
jgi:predicted PurR-regulated permease PerM